jgi:methylated-DNA-[protein]-cysteine S-methyltransferase
MTKLWIDTIDSPIGQISIVVDEDRLCALDFADYQPRMMKLLAQRYESVELVPHSNPLGLSLIHI